MTQLIPSAKKHIKINKIIEDKSTTLSVKNRYDMSTSSEILRQDKARLGLLFKDITIFESRLRFPFGFLECADNDHILCLSRSKGAAQDSF